MDTLEQLIQSAEKGNVEAQTQLGVFYHDGRGTAPDYKKAFAWTLKAAAQGLSIASVLNDLNTPMPNYRFYYLLQKALELCGELKSLGGAMLSAIENPQLPVPPFVEIVICPGNCA